MNNRTVQRGASARFLALLASFTMIIAGFAGFLLAGPASAGEVQSPENDYHKVWICHADMERGNGHVKLGNGEYKVGFNLIEIDENAWGPNNAHYQHPLDKQVFPSFDEETDEWIPPTIEDCGPDVSVFYCPEDSANPDTVLDGPYDAETDLRTCYVPAIEVAATCNASLTASVDANGYDPDDLQVVVTVDGVEVVEAGSWEDGTFSYSLALSDTKSHTIKVDLYDLGLGEVATPIGTKSASNEDCTPKVLTCEDRGDCPPPPPAEVTPPVEVTPVVEAAVASVPEAAAIAPAPATVSVPAAAKLPAAVPAGDGSEAPAVPLWALALMVVGLLGAGISARSWAASRK